MKSSLNKPEATILALFLMSCTGGSNRLPTEHRELPAHQPAVRADTGSDQNSVEDLSLNRVHVPPNSENTANPTSDSAGEDAGNPMRIKLGSRCKVETRSWLIELRPKRRTATQIGAAINRIRRLESNAQVGCYADGTVYVELSTIALRQLVGPKHVELTCMPGAGNRIGASAYRGQLVPKRYVPPNLADVVHRVAINTDPKWPHGYELIDCERLLSKRRRSNTNKR